MVQSLHLASMSGGERDQGMQRLNRLPIIVAVTLLLLFFGIIIYGLASRGLSPHQGEDTPGAMNGSASSFADQLKRGVTDGIIGEPEQISVVQHSPVIAPAKETRQDPVPDPARTEPGARLSRLEPEAEWLARLEREHREQYLRERHRQQMARLQSRGAALDSPLKVDLDELASRTPDGVGDPLSTAGERSANASGLYSAAAQAGLTAMNQDPNQQSAKEDFLNHQYDGPGYLPNRPTPQSSPFELKRGSVIPATLITGVNSDLPGRITAQVSQNVYDSATGHHLLVPQGAKLMGRYDSKVSFGQSRILVVWTDVIFPDGSTLQIGGMAGTDAAGFGGFKDQVDRHTLRAFGSAALIALIGAGMDMSLPDEPGLLTTTSASDAARRSFSETFGRVIEGSLSKNLNVQPTLSIRPGYRFNVLVDQDIVFARSFRP
ncbi:MAG: IncP-type conjugal transfer protein TrbI [Allorhizobium sp.]